MRELLTLTKVMMTEKKAILLSILLGFIAAISSIGLLGTGGYLLSQAALHPPLYTLTLTIILVRFFGLTRAASRYAERYFSHKATFSILGRLRVYFYDKIEPLAPALFANYRSGDLLSRVVADVDRLQYFFLRVFYPPFVMLVVFIATGVMVFTFSIGMTVILFIGFIIVGFIIPILFALLTEKIGYHLREKRSLLSVEITELLFGFTDLKTNRRLNNKIEQINHLSKQLIADQEKDGVLKAKGESLSLTAAYITAWSTLLIGIILVAEGSLNGVYLAMLVLITLTVFEVATPMAHLPGHIEESKVAAKRLFQLTKIKEEKKSEISGVEMVGNGKLKPAKIVFDHVSFSYPKVERHALKKISFEIPEKKKIAIVGASGSGKSSLLNLLLKYYHTYDGEILIGEKPLELYSEEEARSFFSVVAQENHFFNDTIRANLILANPDASELQMKKVLEDVSLKQISLEDRVSEKGLSLSGGERQRLAIARMLLKDAPIVLLDEPTNGLDSMTEKEVMSILWPQVDDRTVIYITHRLVGLEKMDKILVFNKGELVEQGNFDELIKKQGYFYKLKQIEMEKIY